MLDLTLYLSDGFIRRDVYSKPTDSHLYLPPSNAHPKHVFNYKAIPYGVATRLQRNCSEEIFLAKRITEYKGYLINQGNAPKLVDSQFSKAFTILRSDLLKLRRKGMKTLFPFVTTFNPNLPDVGHIIKRHLHIIESGQLQIKRTFSSKCYYTIFSQVKKSQRITSTIPL